MSGLTKNWYMSKSVWGSVLTILTGLGLTTGILSPESAGIINDDGPQFIVGLTTVATGGLSFIGRLSAVHKLK